MSLPLCELVEVSERVASTPSRTRKVELMAGFLLAAPAGDRSLCALYLSGAVRQRKLGVGSAQLSSMRGVPPGLVAGLSVQDVDQRLEAIAAEQGAGSGARRLGLLRELFLRATDVEQRFLVRLLLGELRQGALQSLVIEAVAHAAEVPIELLRRAHMLAADFLLPVEAALSGGEIGLREYDLELFRPVQPMLADTAEGVADALDRLGRAAFEYKFDGARVQVHKRGSEVRIYTRTLSDVTATLPETVELVAGFAAPELILDGEVIALRGGRPLPFQETMRRFGRKLQVHELRSELPMSSFFFDCLFASGRSLIDEPTEARVRALDAAVPAVNRVPRLVTGEPEQAQSFLAEALARGHEGVMAKALDAFYVAGRRGASWLKIKQARTLDLVVLAAEWGSGRRSGLLSNLHLGARDPSTGGFVMLGKTFKGMTDELLHWQTDALLARETHRDGIAVHVRPELVVEIAFNDIQRSSRYPGGFALRFARVRGYRPDKSSVDADTIDTVRAIYARSAHGEEA